MAYAMASRTFWFVSGVWLARPKLSSFRKFTRRIRVAEMRALGELLTTSIWSGGTFRMMSTPPDRSSAIWVVVSGMVRNTMVLICGIPFGLSFQYSLLASTIRCSAFLHSTCL